MTQNNNHILPAVAVAIFNGDGEILLQKRKDVGKWCVISGHVEFGETVENAVLREIEEETNVKADIVRLIGIYSSPVSQTYFYDDKTIQYITAYFEAKLADDLRPGFTNNETTELRFFSPKNIPEDMALINSNWLSDALDKNGKVYIR
jgi:8-oxo-dGTP diphosphatase